METGEPQPKPIEQAGKILPELPYTYERARKRDRAQYREWRVNPVTIKGQKNLPRTDEEIIESIRREHEEKEWFTSKYWREKGPPAEQIEFTINGKTITVYNFNAKKPFSDDKCSPSRHWQTNNFNKQPRRYNSMSGSRNNRCQFNTTIYKAVLTNKWRCELCQNYRPLILSPSISIDIPPAKGII